jgi:hypothetical protein
MTDALLSTAQEPDRLLVEELVRETAWAAMAI